MHSLHHILAVMDLSVPGEHAAWRAARIAQANGAAVHLLQRLDGLDRRPVSRFGPSSPLARSRADLSHLAREIEHALAIKVTHAVCADDGPARTREAAAKADLVVMPRARPMRWSELLQGGRAAQVLRECAVAVLITRLRPSQNYRKVLAGVDLSEDAQRVLALSARLSPFGSVEALHAMSRADEDGLVPEPAVGRADGLGDKALERARSAVQTLAHRAGVKVSVSAVRGQDSSGPLLQRQGETGANLLALCKTPRAWWADLALGSAAQRALAQAPCDVLWVPAAAAGRSRAARTTAVPAHMKTAA